jgi:hypothetical protein
VRYRAIIRCRGCPAGTVPFLSRQERYPKEGDPKVASFAALRIPCASRLNAAAAELAPAMRPGRSNSPRGLPRIELRCSARPTGLCPWLRLCLSLANLGRVGSLLPTDPRGQNCPPYKNILPCKPLWYCLTALLAGQYQSGIQPDEKTANRSPLPFAPPRTGSRSKSPRVSARNPISANSRRCSPLSPTPPRGRGDKTAPETALLLARRQGDKPIQIRPAALPLIPLPVQVWREAKPPAVLWHDKAPATSHSCAGNGITAPQTAPAASA